MFSSVSREQILAAYWPLFVGVAVVFHCIGIWFGFQTVINVGAAAGMLPTKGLTLPLVSYGGSSLIAMSIAVALLLRIDFEMRRDSRQALQKGTV